LGDYMHLSNWYGRYVACRHPALPGRRPERVPMPVSVRPDRVFPHGIRIAPSTRAVA